MGIAGNFANEAFSRKHLARSLVATKIMATISKTVRNEIIDILVAIYKSSQIKTNALSARCDSEQMSFVIEPRKQTINGISDGYQILCTVGIGILMSPHMDDVFVLARHLREGTTTRRPWTPSAYLTGLLDHRPDGRASGFANMYQ
jgi:hypothetical protein